MTSPAEYLANLLAAEELGEIPVPPNFPEWPIYYSSMPDSTTVPDNAIAIYDTTGWKQGREMRGGRSVIHPGVQIKVRSHTYKLAYNKIKSITDFMDSVKLVTVIVDDGSATIAAIVQGPIVGL